MTQEASTIQKRYGQRKKRIERESGILLGKVSEAGVTETRLTGLEDERSSPMRVLSGFRSIAEMSSHA